MTFKTFCMKINFLFWLLLGYCLLPVCLQAQQQYSDWSVDPKVKTLKTRYMQYKANDGYRWIKMEVMSSIECRLQITSTLCNKDRNDVNGWKSIKLERDTPKTIGFKVKNSCINGWWWWYRAYNPIVYTY